MIRAENVIEGVHLEDDVSCFCYEAFAAVENRRCLIEIIHYLMIKVVKPPEGVLVDFQAYLSRKFAPRKGFETVDRQMP